MSLAKATIIGNLGRDPEARIPYLNGDGTATIPLTQDKVALIDEDDLPRVAPFLWAAWKPRNTWYAVTTIQGKKVVLHRFVIGAKPGQVTDHINNDGLDNRKSNLRLCSNTDNSKNRGAQRNNSTGYKGVSLTEDGTYDARITSNGKQMYLGRFATASAAARAYDAAARTIHGEFARTNFSEERAA